MPAGGGGFRMPVSDVFVIARRGTVVTGMVESGSVSVGATVTIERAGRPPVTAEVGAIEMFRKTVRQAGPGDRIGLLLRGVDRGEVAAGDLVSAPILADNPIAE